MSGSERRRYGTPLLQQRYVLNEDSEEMENREVRHDGKRDTSPVFGVGLGFAIGLMLSVPFSMQAFGADFAFLIENNFIWLCVAMVFLLAADIIMKRKS
jgi:hypothetical protein